MIRASLLIDASHSVSAPSRSSFLLTTVSPYITVFTVAFCKQLRSHSNSSHSFREYLSATSTFALSPTLSKPRIANRSKRYPLPENVPNEALVCTFGKKHRLLWKSLKKRKFSNCLYIVITYKVLRFTQLHQYAVHHHGCGLLRGFGLRPQERSPALPPPSPTERNWFCFNYLDCLFNSCVHDYQLCPNRHQLPSSQLCIRWSCCH
jgi:hypothetical protein